MDISTEKSNRTLVMGLGNRVMTDDGVGLDALAALQEEYELPETVDFFDGGTLGLELLVYMEGYQTVLIADCMMGYGTLGQVVRVEAEEVETVFAQCLSPHQMGLQDVIAVLRLQQRVPRRLTVVGVEGQSIDLGVEPTPEIRAAVPEMVRMMVEVLREWGIAATPRTKAAAAS